MTKDLDPERTVPKKSLSLKVLEKNVNSLYEQKKNGSSKDESIKLPNMSLYSHVEELFKFIEDNYEGAKAERNSKREITSIEFLTIKKPKHIGFR